MTKERWEEVYRIRGDVVRREIAGETILVPVRGNLADMQRIFSLNAVGACVWESLDGERALSAAREAVLGRFDAPPGEVEADILEFIDSPVEAGLVERVEE